MPGQYELYACQSAGLILRPIVLSKRPVEEAVTRGVSHLHVRKWCGSHVLESSCARRDSNVHCRGASYETTVHLPEGYCSSYWKFRGAHTMQVVLPIIPYYAH
jgi:hypothetical protein